MRPARHDCFSSSCLRPLIVVLSPPDHTCDADMSDINAQNSRVSLGYGDPWVTTAVKGHRYNDRSQYLLNEICYGDSNCNLHSKGCWGFFVVRTCFGEGDDERVAQAMAKLHQLFATNVEMHRAESYPSNPTYLAADAELMRRFHNILIVDSELRDASVGEVRRYLSKWIESIPQPRGGPRYTTFVLLDSQLLDDLNQLPDKFYNRRMGQNLL